MNGKKKKNKRVCVAHVHHTLANKSAPQLKLCLALRWKIRKTQIKIKNVTSLNNNNDLYVSE